MPSRREFIQMSEIEIQEFLETQRRVVLVTNGLDSMPHPVAMEYGLDAGNVVMTSFGKSQKIRNLERDPRATLLFESGTQYHELKGVIAYCNVQIIREPELVATVMRLVRAGDILASSVSQDMSAQVQASILKRVAVRLTPFRFVTWDHSKLPGLY